MITLNEMKWRSNYNELLSYVKEHHQLPDKKKPEFRHLINWWKYNKRCYKKGKLTAERIVLLRKLSDLRTNTLIKW